SRIYVNVPDAQEIAVVARAAQKLAKGLRAALDQVNIAHSCGAAARQRARMSPAASPATGEAGE
ncbi:MAG TPA: hypothetical protein VF113_18050, partial [Stellaceae bacterium]